MQRKIQNVRLFKIILNFCHNPDQETLCVSALFFIVIEYIYISIGLGHFIADEGRKVPQDLSTHSHTDPHTPHRPTYTHGLSSTGDRSQGKREKDLKKSTV